MVELPVEGLLVATGGGKFFFSSIHVLPIGLVGMVLQDIDISYWCLMWIVILNANIVVTPLLLASETLSGL